MLENCVLERGKEKKKLKINSGGQNLDTVP